MEVFWVLPSWSDPDCWPETRHAIRLDSFPMTRKLVVWMQPCFAIPRRPEWTVRAIQYWCVPWLFVVILRCRVVAGVMIFMNVMVFFLSSKRSTYTDRERERARGRVSKETIEEWLGVEFWCVWIPRLVVWWQMWAQRQNSSKIVDECIQLKHVVVVRTHLRVVGQLRCDWVG